MIILISRKTIRFSALISAVLILLCAALTFVWGGRNSARSERNSVFVTSSDASEGKRQIEVFDISAGKVTAKYPQSAFPRSEACRYLKGITSVYIHVKAFPERGLIVRIPLDPPVRPDKELLKKAGLAEIRELFVLLPEQEDPRLLILDSRERPLFFNFKADMGVLSELLKQPGT